MSSPAPVRLLAILLLASFSSDAAAQNVRVVDIETAPVLDKKPPKSTLPPALEKKVADFLAKLGDARVKAWNASMQDEVDKVVKDTNLDDAGKKTLQAAAAQAVKDTCTPWEAKIGDVMRTEISAQPVDQVGRMLDLEISQVDEIAQHMDAVTDVTEPADQDAWKAGLKKTLSADQFAAWSKAEADRTASIDKDIGPAVKMNSDRIRTQEMAQITGTCKSLESELNLDKARSDQLEALAKSAVDEAVDKFTKRIEHLLERMPKQSLQGVSFGEDPNEAPTGLAAWKDGLAKILTADDLKRLDTEKAARRTRREVAMGNIMIMLLDEQIAFTTAQRQRFEPIAERLVKDQPQLYPEQDSSGSFQAYPPQVFYAAASKLSDAELKPIFDEAQRRRWKSLADVKGPEQAQGFNLGQDAAPATDTGPADVEQCISTFLFDRAESERKRVLASNLLKAEDVVRVAGVGSDAAARLETAARGVTEDYLVNWSSMIEQQVRNQLQDPTPQTIKQRLANIQPFFFQNSVFVRQRYGAPDNSPGIWEETVKTELSPEQKDAWEKETSARADFRDQAIAGMVVSEFDRSFALNQQQCDKLQPLLTAIVHDDEQQISQMFGGFNGAPWYMGSFYCLIPFAGIADTDLDAILTKDQVTAWKASQEFANGNNLWQNIQVRAQQMQRIRAQPVPAKPVRAQPVKK